MTNKILCLDLGSGPIPYCLPNISNAEIVGIDINFKNNHVIKRDLFLKNIPFKDSTFDIVTAMDFLEHVPRLLAFKKKVIYPFINLMNEVYRVLKTNSKFVIQFPYSDNLNDFYLDPTHVNPLSEDTLSLYFCKDDTRSISDPWAKALGYGFNGCFEFTNIVTDTYGTVFNNNILKKVVTLTKIA